ncbi:MAG: hypothetical protein WD228_08015 [Mycobacterium sp.]
MSKAAELAELHQHVSNLRRCVQTLQNRFGDAPGMRRVVLDTERILNDLELLEVDASELELISHSAEMSGEKIQVPDTPYDREFWRDVDDEGVGGHNRR